MATADFKDVKRRRLDSVRLSIHGIFALSILYTLYLAHEVILPITLAVLTSLLLSPLVRRLARCRIPRVVSAFVLLAALVSAMAGVGWMVATPIMDWLERAPEGISNLLAGEGGVKGALSSLMRSAEKVEKTVEGLTESKQPVAVVLQSESWTGLVLMKLRNGLVGLALALALTFFLLVNGDRLIHNLVRQLPRYRRRTGLRLIRESQREIARYLAVITLSNTAVGLVTMVMLWWLELPNAAVWGVLAGLLRFIPYLGVIVTVLLLSVISAVTLSEPWMMLIAPAGYILLTALVGFFIEPFIHGYRMSINPIIIFLAIFFWGWLWGAVGVLLAVPLMTVIQVILKQTEALKPVYRIIAR